jgi:hypothetical protein
LTIIEAWGADQGARGEIAVEDFSFTIRPGTVTGFVVRTWRADDDERGLPRGRNRGTQTNLGASFRIEHHSTNAASVRSFGERGTVKVTIPPRGEHGAQQEAVDDCRVRYRAAALAAARVRLISCR